MDENLVAGGQSHESGTELNARPKAALSPDSNARADGVGEADRVTENTAGAELEFGLEPAPEAS
jgi:hypothetical protein